MMYVHLFHMNWILSITLYLLSVILYMQDGAIILSSSKAIEDKYVSFSLVIELNENFYNFDLYW